MKPEKIAKDHAQKELGEGEKVKRTKKTAEPTAEVPSKVVEVEKQKGSKKTNQAVVEPEKPAEVEIVKEKKTRKTKSQS